MDGSLEGYESRSSRVDPERYADTGFSVKDTALEINARIFAAMMRKTPAERVVMGFAMSEMARTLVWSSIPSDMPVMERKRAF